MKSQSSNSHGILKPWTATIDSNNRITIPKAIRDEFGLRAGDIVTFMLHGDGTLSLRVFRRQKKGLWLDLITRQLVDHLPEWRPEPSLCRLRIPYECSPEEAIERSVGQLPEDPALASLRFENLPGEILREDFIWPLGLSAKKIADAVTPNRKQAAEFAQRLEEFMSDSTWGLDVDDCLRLDRFFGLNDGYFWRVISACQVGAGVIEYADLLAQIKPMQRQTAPLDATVNQSTDGVRPRRKHRPDAGSSSVFGIMGSKAVIHARNGLQRRGIALVKRLLAANREHVGNAAAVRKLFEIPAEALRRGFRTDRIIAFRDDSGHLRFPLDQFRKGAISHWPRTVIRAVGNGAPALHFLLAKRSSLGGANFAKKIREDGERIVPTLVATAESIAADNAPRKPRRLARAPRHYGGSSAGY